MDQELDKLNKQLSEVSESIICTNSEIRSLTRGIEDFHYIFHDAKRFMVDLKDMWQKGSMNIMIQDVEAEIKHHQRELFNSLEDEKHALKNHINNLEEKQLRLVSKRKTLEGD